MNFHTDSYHCCFIEFYFLQFRNSHSYDCSLVFRHFNSNHLLCYFVCVHKVKTKTKRYTWCLVSAHMDGLRFNPFTISISHASLLTLSLKKTYSPIRSGHECPAHPSGKFLSLWFQSNSVVVTATLFSWKHLAFIKNSLLIQIDTYGGWEKY